MTSKILFNQHNKPTGIKRVYLAALNSIRALKWLVKNEAAFKQELALLLLAIPITFLLKVSASDQIILLSAIVFIMLIEVINTAIETVVDRIGLEMHPLSGLAKDLGSVAVLMSFIIAVAIWSAVLL